MTTHRLWTSLCIVLLHISLSLAVEQVQAQKDGVNRLDKGTRPYETWANRRLHTLDIWLSKAQFDEKTKSNELAPNKWYSIQFFMNKEEASDPDKVSVVFSWNLHSSVRSAFTYLNFTNEPLGPETVRYEITTTMFDIENATTNPVETSTEHTKNVFKFNSSHIMMWTNDVLTVKLFLRDIPLDLGNTKFFKFLNFNEDDLYKIYYWDPTVFCWTDCYDDALPDKFHFDRERWLEGYTEKELGEQCKIVNCTAKMGEDLKGTALTPSEFPRCVRLHHTPQGQDDQKVLLKCTNENYTYTACEAFPGKPCWYEVCDNFDLCNSSPSSFPSLLTLFLLLFVPYLIALHR